MMIVFIFFRIYGEYFRSSLFLGYFIIRMFYKLVIDIKVRLRYYEVSICVILYRK